MYGFLIKKNFCDGWDHMLSIIVPNVFSLLIGTLTLYLVSNIFAGGSPFAVPLVCLVCILGYALFIMPAAAFSDNAAKISDFGSPSIKDFFTNFFHNAKWGFFFGLMEGAIVVVGVIGIPFYFKLGVEGSVFGYILAAIMFWFELIVLLSLQWFMPLKTLLHNDFKKTLKKCFILFFDNMGMSFFMAIYDIILSILSVLFIMMLPSAAGILLGKTNILRICLYKYDWLDQHPDLKDAKSRKNIPWAELIHEDEETLGHRSFKSFFMPWKED